MSIAKVCKFQKERLEISYDCGETFEPTSETRKIEGREPVERNSTDCGFQISRMTVESGHTCNGYHKYTQLVDKISYDGEQTWDVIEGSNRIGALSERWSPDCCQLRTVSGTVCTEMFRKANVDIQEASLDGEHWIRTGKYTVNEYLDEYNLECMNQYGVKFLGVPVSGASGLSHFDYQMYTTSASSSAITAVGANDNYVIIGCESSSNTFDTGTYEDAGGSQIANSAATENIKYIFINDCAVNPEIWSYADYSSLEKIYISSGVSGSFGVNRCKLGGGFSSFSALTEIVGIENSHITSIGSYSCEGSSIGAFEDTLLTSIELPNTCTSLVGAVFSHCTSLSSATINANYLTTLGDAVFLGCTALENVTFPNDYYGGTGNNMFYGCTSLTSVTLGRPDYIGVQSFSDCTSLSSITLGDRITYIGDRAFAGCSSLKDVYIGQKSNILANVRNTSFPSGVTIHVPCEAYGYWHQAAEIDHPEVGWTIAIWGDSGCVETQWVESGTTCVGVDKYSKYIEQIRFGTSDTWHNTGNESAVTLIEADSVDCGYVPQDYYIKVEFANGSQAALECLDAGDGGVTRNNITFSGSNFTKIWIEGCSCTRPTSYLNANLFYNMYTVQEVHLPSCITWISNYCFYGATGLTSINLDYITHINQSAFFGCYSLSSVTIPSTMQYIEARAFGSCTSLQSITCLGTTPPQLRMYGQAKGWFDNTNNCPIYVPASAVNTYKGTQYWSDYADRIQAIPNS